MGHPVTFAVLLDKIKRAFCVQFMLYTVFILVIRLTAVFQVGINVEEPAVPITTLSLIRKSYGTFFELLI